MYKVPLEVLQKCIDLMSVSKGMLLSKETVRLCDLNAHLNRLDDAITLIEENYYLKSECVKKKLQ